MLTTQKYYNNVPIKIGNYTLVEVYIDSIADANFQGYRIFPLDGIDDINQYIEDTIVYELGTPGEEYELAILAGNDNNQYNHCLVYAVWYVGEPPTYPDAPVVPAQPAPATEYNVWQSISINNPGNDTNAKIELSVSSGDIELIINNDYFLIKGNTVNGAQCVISKDGVSINSVPAQEYYITNTPMLKHGINIIKINKTNITHINVRYKICY